MPEWLDTALVFAAVIGALLYFVIRRLRRGGAHGCGSCCSAGGRNERIGAAALTGQAKNKVNREPNQLSNAKINQQ